MTPGTLIPWLLVNYVCVFFCHAQLSLYIYYSLIPPKNKPRTDFWRVSSNLSNIAAYKISCCNNHNARVTVPPLNDHSLEVGKHRGTCFLPPQFDSMIQLRYDLIADKRTQIINLFAMMEDVFFHHISRFRLFLLKAIGRSGCDWRVCSNNSRVGLSLNIRTNIGRWPAAPLAFLLLAKVQQVLQRNQEANILFFSQMFLTIQLTHVQ